MTYMSLCVVMTDWGNLRDEIFSRTGFAPSAYLKHVTHSLTLSESNSRSGSHKGLNLLRSNTLHMLDPKRQHYKSYQPKLASRSK